MKSKKRSTWTIVLIIIGIIIVLIIGSTFYRIVTWDRLVNHLKTSFLAKDSECELPCWNGIIPGETNVSEALTILEMDPSLDSLKREFEDNEYGKNVSLRSDNILIGGELILLELENDIVTGITFPDQIKMSLSEVLTTFGLPSSVFPIPGGPSFFYWHFIMYYPDKGIVINIVTDEDEDVGEITPSSRVFYVMFTPKDVVESMIEEDKIFQRKVKKPIVFPCPWKGYGDIYDLYEGSWW